MAFDLDDLDPKQKKPQPRNLDAMNIEDLKEYAAALKAELARLDVAVQGRLARNAAMAGARIATRHARQVLGEVKTIQSAARTRRVARRPGTS